MKDNQEYSKNDNGFFVTLGKSNGRIAKERHFENTSQS